jgi:hypothetical protein
MQELKSAHDAAIQANPDLATEGKQLQEQMEAFKKKMDAAMIAADPNVAPIIQKMEANHKHHGGPGGPGGDDDDDDGPPPPPPADGTNN